MEIVQLLLTNIKWRHGDMERWQRNVIAVTHLNPESILQHTSRTMKKQQEKIISLFSFYFFFFFFSVFSTCCCLSEVYWDISEDDEHKHHPNNNVKEHSSTTVHTILQSSAYYLFGQLWGQIVQVWKRSYHWRQLITIQNIDNEGLVEYHPHLDKLLLN